MIIVGDCLEKLRDLPDQSVQTCVTSPPYWGLRDYGVPGQIGLEKTPDEFVVKMVEVFREVRRVLKDDGTLWLNLGDSYAGNGGQYGDAKSTLGGRKQSGVLGAKRFLKRGNLKSKDLCGIPWRVALTLQADGWYLRQDIIWHKPNPMPESVRDRCTKAHEYIFMCSKMPSYYYDHRAIKEPCVSVSPAGNKDMLVKGRLSPSYKRPTPEKSIPAEGRNKRSVWTVTTKPFKGAHFATFPPDLIEPCILAGSRPGDTVLDPFAGAGTTWLVSQRHNREFIGIELNPEYAEMARQRVQLETPLLLGIS